VPEHLKITSEFMTDFEYARVIGERAAMIEQDGIHYIEDFDEDDETITAMDIAKMELLRKICPLLI